MKRIDQLYAFVADDENGDEAIPAMLAPQDHIMLPLVGADLKRVESLKIMAQQFADQSGKPVYIRVFTGYTEAGVIYPRGKKVQ